jgi:hypothetical protein
MVFATAYKVFRPLWMSSVVLSGVKATSGNGIINRVSRIAINTKDMKDENLRLIADTYLYIGDATLDFTSHQFKYLPPEWVKKNTPWGLNRPQFP